jgi:hypothetical protein
MVAADTDDERRIVLQRRDDRRRHGIGDRGNADRPAGLPLAQLTQGRGDTVGIDAREREAAYFRQFRHQHDEACAREGAGERLQARLVATQDRGARTSTIAARTEEAGA